MALKRKSIRLEIELPIDSDQEHSDTELNMVKACNKSNKKTPIKQIHLKISIDNSTTKKQKQNNKKISKPITEKTSVWSTSLTTSGYSSAGSSNHSLVDTNDIYEYLNDINEQAFCAENEQDLTESDDSCQSFPCLNKRKRDFCASNENIYDKLIHNSAKTRKIVSYNYKKPSQQANDLSLLSTDFEENIYEDISNFVEANELKKKFKIEYENLKEINKPEQIYENQSFFSSQIYSNVSKVNRKGYQKEYTVNEIFDNLKKFKKQAKEQELLNESIKIKKNEQIHLYENERISKSIYV